MADLKVALDFLDELSRNNNRPWFIEHKGQFDLALKEVSNFATEVKTGLERMDVIEKMKVFRIYRDVRFSTDKTPYKSNFGMSFTREGKHRRGGYYLQIEPGNSFLGAGFWAPEKADVQRIRQELAVDASILRNIVADPQFIKLFGKLTGDELKSAPSGFDKDHPNIDLIRMKQFLVYKSFSDKEVLSKEFVDVVVSSFEAVRPFFDYFSLVLTTDLNGESTVN